MISTLLELARPAKIQAYTHSMATWVVVMELFTGTLDEHELAMIGTNSVKAVHSQSALISRSRVGKKEGPDWANLRRQVKKHVLNTRYVQSNGQRVLIVFRALLTLLNSAEEVQQRLMDWGLMDSTDVDCNKKVMKLFTLKPLINRDEALEPQQLKVLMAGVLTGLGTIIKNWFRDSELNDRKCRTLTWTLEYFTELSSLIPLDVLPHPIQIWKRLSVQGLDYNDGNGWCSGIRSLVGLQDTSTLQIRRNWTNAIRNSGASRRNQTNLGEAEQKTDNSEAKTDPVVAALQQDEVSTPTTTEANLARQKKRGRGTSLRKLGLSKEARKTFSEDITKRLHDLLIVEGLTPGKGDDSERRFKKIKVTCHSEDTSPEESASSSESRTSSPPPALQLADVGNATAQMIPLPDEISWQEDWPLNTGISSSRAEVTMAAPLLGEIHLGGEDGTISPGSLADHFTWDN